MDRLKSYLHSIFPIISKVTLIGLGVTLLTVGVCWLVGWHTLLEIGFSLLAASFLIALPATFWHSGSNYATMTHYHVKGDMGKRVKIAHQLNERLADFSMLALLSAILPLLFGLGILWIDSTMK